MSEYPVSCSKCGLALGYVHATKWHDNYLCKKCYLEKYPKANLDGPESEFGED